MVFLLPVSHTASPQEEEEEEKEKEKKSLIQDNKYDNDLVIFWLAVELKRKRRKKVSSCPVGLVALPLWMGVRANKSHDWWNWNQ